MTSTVSEKRSATCRSRWSDVARALILRHVDSHIDALHCKDGDAALARALGLFLSGCLILAWAGRRLTGA